MSFHKAMGRVLDTIDKRGKKVFKIETSVTYNQPGMAEVTIYQYDTDENGKPKVENGEAVTLPKETYYLEKWDETGMYESRFIDITAHGDDGKHFLEWRSELC